LFQFVGKSICDELFTLDQFGFDAPVSIKACRMFHIFIGGFITSTIFGTLSLEHSEFQQ
jgi:hypothetical protein